MRIITLKGIEWLLFVFQAEKSSLSSLRIGWWFLSLLLQEQFLNIPVRDRSNETVPTTRAENISSMEILACADLIEQESGSVEAEELVRVIAKTLGFKRAGPEFQTLNHLVICAINNIQNRFTQP